MSTSQREQRERTRIYVEHPTGEHVCIHEGPTAENDYKRACREEQEAIERTRRLLGFSNGRMTRPVA